MDLRPNSMMMTIPFIRMLLSLDIDSMGRTQERVPVFRNRFSHRSHRSHRNAGPDNDKWHTDLTERWMREEGRCYLSLCFPTELYSFHRLSLPKLACSARSHSGKFTILSCAILTRYILASIRSGVWGIPPFIRFLSIIVNIPA